MAYHLPDASFVGVDFSGRQVEQARDIASAAGIDNCELVHGDIAALDDSLGDFDYLICHGVYSWVPGHVQDAILRLAREGLRPNGVAYVSYNVYPGWHMRGMIRDMMLYHTAGFDDPVVKVAQARALLDFMASNASEGASGAYRTLLGAELDTLRGAGDYYLRHEHLSEDNSSVYFHEFMSRAHEHGLQYLAETQLASMIASNLPAAVADTLAKLAPDILRMEQYMDFLRNRTFRQTLLTHAAVPITRHLTGTTLDGLHLSAQLLPGAPADGGATVYRTPHGSAVNARDPVLRGWLEQLREAWPTTLEARALFDAVGRDNPVLDAGTERLDNARTELTRTICGGIVNLHAQPIGPRPALGERPRASAIARAQARHGNAVCNRLHRPVKLSDLGAQLIRLADGTRGLDELVAAMVRAAGDGVLNVARDGASVTAHDELAAIMAGAVPATLTTLSEQELLEA